MFTGATVGAIIWVPTLLATLLCFGLPIARAQRLAKKGLAGAEYGEGIVGVACVTISVVGLLLSLAMNQSRPWLDVDPIWVARLFGLLGALAGASSTTLAWVRGARRRAFVAAAEAGNVKGYRVDTTDEGKVLVRIAAQGKGYRWRISRRTSSNSTPRARRCGQSTATAWPAADLSPHVDLAGAAGGLAGRLSCSATPAQRRAVRRTRKRRMGYLLAAPVARSQSRRSPPCDRPRASSDHGPAPATSKKIAPSSIA